MAIAAPLAETLGATLAATLAHFQGKEENCGCSGCFSLMWYATAITRKDVLPALSSCEAGRTAGWPKITATKAIPTSAEPSAKRCAGQSI